MLIVRIALIVAGGLALIWAAIQWLSTAETNSPSMRAEIARSYRLWGIGGVVLLAIGLGWPLIEGAF